MNSNDPRGKGRQTRKSTKRAILPKKDLEKKKKKQKKKEMKKEAILEDPRETVSPLSVSL